MPDIDLKCPKCGAVTSISEYATTDVVTCANCGGAIQKPPPVTEKRKPTVRRNERLELVARAEDPGPPPAAAAAESPAPQAHPTVMARVDRKARSRSADFRQAMTPEVISWLVMGLVGVPLAWARYGGYMPPATTGSMTSLGFEYGPIFLVLAQAIVVLEAFRDEFFFGMLSLVVPFYSMYYLFTRSANLILRVVVFFFLLLCAVGTYNGVMEYAHRVFVQVSTWIGQNDTDDSMPK